MAGNHVVVDFQGERVLAAGQGVEKGPLEVQAVRVVVVLDGVLVVFLGLQVDRLELVDVYVAWA